jgi:hypothetical protein
MNVSVEDRTRAIKKGVREALRESALLGHSICIWRDGKVVWLSPPEILEELKRTAPGTTNGSTQEPHD